jgi:hypothetical protein
VDLRGPLMDLGVVGSIKDEDRSDGILLVDAPGPGSVTEFVLSRLCLCKNLGSFELLDEPPLELLAGEVGMYIL